MCSLSADNFLAHLGIRRLQSGSRAEPGYGAAASTPLDPLVAAEANISGHLGWGLLAVLPANL